MQRVVPKTLLLAILVTLSLFSFSGPVQAAGPVGPLGPQDGNGGKVQGFDRKGAQGAGLFGGNNGAQPHRVANRPTQANFRPQAQQANLQYNPYLQFQPQFGLQYGLQYAPQFGLQYRQQFGLQYGLQYGPQFGLQYGPQFGLQVPYPLTVGGYVDTDYGPVPATTGNPFNSFAPAGSFGFGR
jgi:hypothetical protein